MHELSLTENVIAIVKSESEKQGFTRVLEISLRIGELSGIIPDCMREFFPIAAKGTVAEGAALAIETVPAAFRCNDCGWEGRFEKHSYSCPVCGGCGVKMTSGREFYVESIKVE